jgi:hypothetical protein
LDLNRKEKEKEKMNKYFTKSSVFVSLVFALLLSVALMPNAYAATITVTGTPSNRYPSANVDIDGDGQLEWIMEPNLWNIVSGSGSITMTFDTSAKSLSVNIDLSNIKQEDPNGWVNAYPEIWYGAKAWNTLGPATDGPIPIPKQLKSLNDFTTKVSYSLSCSDSNLPRNFPLETWLTHGDRGSVSSDEVEFMIWMPCYNILQGAGSNIGSITVGSYTYEIWRSDACGNGQWEYFAFRPTTSGSNSATVTVQWGTFLQKGQSLSNRGSPAGNWANFYFTAVELGTEFGSPSYLSTNKFSWSLSNWDPSTVFSSLSTNILGAAATTTTTTTTPTTTTTTTTTPTTTATVTGVVTSTITSTRTTTITSTRTTTSRARRTTLTTTITSTIKTTLTTTIGTTATTTTTTPTTTTATTATTTVATGTTCSPATDISIPFTKDGAGTYCWRLQATSTLTDPNNYSNYINSWNLQTLTVNGVDYTNKYAFTHDLPSPINGYWYIYYVGNYAWSHFEAK